MTATEPSRGSRARAAHDLAERLECLGIRAEVDADDHVTAFGLRLEPPTGRRGWQVPTFYRQWAGAHDPMEALAIGIEHARASKASLLAGLRMAIASMEADRARWGDVPGGDPDWWEAAMGQRMAALLAEVRPLVAVEASWAAAQAKLAAAVAAEAAAAEPTPPR